jgi:hypothetical protein
MEDPGSLPEEILKTPQVIILTLVIIVKSMSVFERIVFLKQIIHQSLKAIMAALIERGKF